ncbi:MAG: iron-enterobactin ABC transporter permease, partial [Microbacterium sp.]
MNGAKVEFGHRRFVLAGGRIVVRVRTAAVTALLAALAVLLGAAALALGDYPVTIAQMIGSFTGATDGLERTAVLEWRLPRAASAL